MTILTRYNFHHHRTSQIKLEKPPIYSSHLLCCAVPISSHLGSFIIWFECEKQIKFNLNHNFYGAVRCFLLFVFFPLARSLTLVRFNMKWIKLEVLHIYIFLIHLPQWRYEASPMWKKKFVIKKLWVRGAEVEKNLMMKR